MARTRADLRASISQAWRLCEMMLLFGVAPVVIWLAQYPHFAKLMTCAALILLAVAHAWWTRTPKSSLGMGGTGLRALVPALLTGAVVGGVIAGGLMLMRSLLGLSPVGRGFANPFYWVVFLLVYGVWSLGQEFAVRAWFFNRYGGLMPRNTLVVLNGLMFGWAHLFFGRWEPVVVTAVGGVVLAWIYDRHRSLVALTLLHLAGGAMMLMFNVGHLFDRVPRSLLSP